MIYKANWAACHGVDAAGKPAAKIPSLVSDEAKKVSDNVKMVVSYIRNLQK